MKSLVALSLEYIAAIADNFSESDFASLPVPVLRELISYLSAFQLNRLHDVFEKAVPVRVETHAMWSAHLTHRWTKSYQRAATLFRDELVDERAPDPRQVYMERHFQWLLGHMATESPKDLMRDIHVSLPLLRRQGAYVAMQSHCSFLPSASSAPPDDLHLYAPHVRVLSIMATSAAMLDLVLNDPALLGVLQRSVRRLVMYFVNERNFARSRRLVVELVRCGGVREFALFSAQLPLQLLSELMGIAAERSVATSVGESGIHRGESLEAPDGVSFVNDGINNTSVDDDINGTSVNDDIDGSGVSQFTLVNSEDDMIINIDPDAAETKSERDDEVVGLNESKVSNDLYSWDEDSSAPNNHSDDLFDVALTSKRMPSRGRGDRPRMPAVLACHGCVSLTMAYLKADYVVQEALSHVLPLWTSLRKLAILEVNISDGEVIQRFLTERIEGGLLSHLVLYDSDVCRNILDVVVMSLLNRNGDEPMQEITLALSDSQAQGLSEDIFSELQERSFYGTVHLDLSGTTLGPEKVGFIPVWIGRDLALRHVYLSSFHSTTIIPAVLCAALETGRIETLSLEGIQLSGEMEAGVLLILQQLHSLHTLNLDHCGLSAQFVNGETFPESIAQHNHLTELHLAHNRLGAVQVGIPLSEKHAGSLILRSVCVDKFERNKFHFLDLSYNRIDGNSLLLAVCDIHENFIKNRSRDRVLFKLGLNGNLFGAHHASVVQQSLLFVDIVVAEVTNITDVNPLVDHVALM